MYLPYTVNRLKLAPNSNSHCFNCSVFGLLSDPDDNVKQILFDLKNNDLMSPTAMADATDADIEAIVHNVDKSYKWKWMRQAAKRLVNDHKTIVPSSRDSLLALSDMTITSFSVSLVLQQAFGFTARPIIDNDCKKAMVALRMADLFEFCSSRGKVDIKKSHTRN